MKILLTGSDGFIGSHVLSALAGRNVVALGRNADLTKSWPDISDFDVVIHLAARVGVKYFRNDYNAYINNLSIDHQFIEALKRCKKQPYIIYASTSEVYGASLDANETSMISVFPELRGSYALEKANTEMMIRALSDKFTILRFFNVTGYDQTDKHGHVLPVFVKKALTSQPIPIFNGGTDVRTFCSVKDVAQVISQVIHIGPIGVMNVGSHLKSNTLTIKELADKVIHFVGNGSTVILPESQNIKHRIPNVDKLRSLGLSCDTSIDDIVLSSINYWKTRHDL